MAEARQREIWFIVLGDEHSHDAQRAKNLAGNWQRLTPVYICCGQGRTRLREVWSLIGEKMPAAVYFFHFNYFSLLVALWCRIVWRRVKFVFDTGDLAYRLSRLFYSSGPQRILIGIYEWIILRLADLVVVRGRWHVEYLRERGLRNVLLIRDGVDLDAVQEKDCRDRKEKLFGPGAFIVGLVGFISWPNKLGVIWYGWDILEASRLLKDTPIRFAMAGFGPGETEFLRKVEEYGLRDKITFMGRMTKEKTSEWLSMFDIVLNTQPNDDAFWVRTTGKLPLYLAADRYILTSDVGEAHYILPPEMLIPYHGLVDQDYPRLLAERIQRLYDDRQLLAIRSGGRQLAGQYFDYPMLSRKLEDALIALPGHAC